MILIALPFLTFTLASCGSFKELMEKQKAQEADRKMLETYIYPERIEVMKKRLLTALNDKRDLDKAPLIVMNKSMGEMKRDDRIAETLRDQGFEFNGNYYVDDSFDLGFALMQGNLKEKLNDSLFKGTYHILIDQKRRVVVVDGALSYELIETHDQKTQLHVYRLKRLVRGPLKLEVDWWKTLSGQFPFLLNEGAISWEKSRGTYANRDMYAELEIYYLLKS